MTVPPEAVDGVLLQVGAFGRFQLINCLVVNMPIMFSALYTIAYVFTARDLAYRCLIPECEQAAGSGLGSSGFLPPWLPRAAPFSDGRPAPCARFALRANASALADPECPADLFDEAVSRRCDRWVFEPGQRSTLVNEWDLTCDDNKWKLSFVGTIGYVGAFVGMPLAGFVSDRYRFGRKSLLLWAWVLASLSGLVQSFSSSFAMFLVLEFGNSFFEAGVYGAGFLLALELVGPEQRAVTTTVLSMFYSGGNALLGVLAWAVRDWRWLLRAVYGGGLAVALPLWFAPESVRWLAARGRLEEADAVVARVAAMNRVPVDKTLVAARGDAVPQKREMEEGGTLTNLLAIFKSRVLVLRFVNCAYCWIANTFVYYGLSLYAVALSGDEYVNFILSGLVEIPANLVALWLQDWAGRRLCQAGSLVVAGVCCLAFLVIPADEQWLQVATYMLGKFAITLSFIVVYVITAEMFPTNARQSMVSYCSTFGRVGSILAPQAPLLATVFEELPLTVFGVVSLAGGLLALLFPETARRPLPETVQEAEDMGSKAPCSLSSLCTAR